MRTFLLGSSVAALFVVGLLGCPPPKPSQQTPAGGAAMQQPAPAQYPATGYPQQQPPPGYAQQQPPPGYAQPQPAPAQGYPQPYPQQQPPPGAAPGAAPAASAAAPMATPGPLALPCQNDSQCGLAHCNAQYAKCAFPCQSATDCIQGASCNTLTGFCLPGG